MSSCVLFLYVIKKLLNYILFWVITNSIAVFNNIFVIILCFLSLNWTISCFVLNWFFEVV